MEVKKVTGKKLNKSVSILDKIKDISEDNNFLKVCLYGNTGTGKTTLCGSFPKPTLFLVASGGNKAGELKSIYTKENIGKVKKIEVEEPNEIEELVNYQKEKNIFKTIVLDNATGLSDLILMKTLGVEELPNKREFFFQGNAIKQAYNTVAFEMKRLLRGLLSTENNIVIIGHERQFGGGDDTETKVDDDLLRPTIGVAVTPSVAGFIHQSCDFICQCFKRPKTRVVIRNFKKGKETIKKETTEIIPGEVEFCLRIAPHSVYSGKMRLPKTFKLPEVITNPEYSKLKELIDKASTIG